MKIFNLITMSLLCAFLISACTEDTFMKNQIPDASMVPTDLSYAPVLNAREFGRVETAPPTISSDGLMPFFELVNIKDKDGNVLGEEYLSDVTLFNAVPDTVYITDEEGDTVRWEKEYDLRKVGKILIDEGNKFGIGDYYFTLKTTTEYGDVKTETVFDDVFHLNVGPLLVSSIAYIPRGVNILYGSDTKSPEPIILTGNPDVTYGMVNYKDTLNIDPETGEISLVSGFNSEEVLVLNPEISIESNISKEVVTFKGIISVWLSEDPVVIPKETIQFFYPTFQAENLKYGYKTETVKEGSVAAWNLWKRVGPSPLAADDRPAKNSSQKALLTNTTVSNVTKQFDSWIITNPQNLLSYELGYGVTATFYYKNQYVEYDLTTGNTPTELEVYISTDYAGNRKSANWTKVNDVVKSWVNTHDGEGRLGMPYPGDQLGVDNGLKDRSFNADGKWVKCELDLVDYTNQNNVTIAFRLKTNFEEDEVTFVKGVGGNRGGTWSLSDVNYKAVEK
ncbi:MAG: hypothetical protein N4A71_03380 [Carboxylicivirga sp.]|jgi:hypothetical protein|nr:hypothetical protein [Carboxylicivirga sp.]